MNNLSTSAGISSFKTLRTQNLPYIDKTSFIAELLRNSDNIEVNQAAPAVTLITRPRRFGKTLLMSTLEQFFDITENSAELFRGLAISGYSNLCANWMNQYPVITLTLKNMVRMDYEQCLREFYIQDLLKLKKKYLPILENELTFQDYKDYFASIRPYDSAYDLNNISSFLGVMLEILHDYYGKKVILLIDEYDVPLAKALEHGYYARMRDFLISFLSCLKDNENLCFAVLTGCLRLSKESLFTGLNNFQCYTVHDNVYAKCCGFTPEEVSELLRHYALEEKGLIIESWYDGYRFGTGQHVYCPWDVINYLDLLKADPEALPKSFWANSASRELLLKLMRQYYFEIKADLEALFKGGYVETAYDENLTYASLLSNVNNFWMLMYFTGYVTACDNGVIEEGSERLILKLCLPNREIKSEFVKLLDEVNVQELNRKRVSKFIEACFNGDATEAGAQLSDLLFDAISYYDYNEVFYHAFTAGLFAGNSFTRVKSNREQGLGRPDLLIINHPKRQALIIECKVAKSDDALEAQADAALKQIDEQRYDAELDPRLRVIKLGLSFKGKKCCARSAIREQVYDVMP